MNPTRRGNLLAEVSWPATLSLAVLLTACGEAKDKEPTDRPDASAAESSAYALAVAVWGPDGPTGYVAVSDTLDRADVRLDEAYEVPGYPSIQASAGQLFVARNEESAIERLTVGTDLSLKPQGMLTFIDQGAESVLFGQQYWQGSKAAFLNLGVSERVHWDPRSLSIEGVVEGSGLAMQRDGLDLFSSYNRTTFVASGDLLVPFVYHDQDWIVWAAETHLALFDKESGRPTHVVEAPCPGLDSITRDEAGNTYLGTWEYSTLFTLMGTGVAPCAAKLKPDNSLDTTWDPDLSRFTEGRLVKNFRYLGEGKAVAGVLYAEEYGRDYDFSKLLESSDDFWATEGRFHRLWMFDLEQGSAKPVSGIEFDFVQPYFSHEVIDGRYFVFLADGSSNQAERTIAYELDLDGKATARFEVAGDIRQWVKVR